MRAAVASASVFLSSRATYIHKGTIHSPRPASQSVSNGAAGWLGPCWRNGAHACVCTYRVLAVRLPGIFRSFLRLFVCLCIRFSLCCVVVFLYIGTCCTVLYCTVLYCTVLYLYVLSRALPCIVARSPYPNTS
ncbi:hypothetical protein IWX49DRAFT_569861 [Phyllosticta citricarpa]